MQLSFIIVNKNTAAMLLDCLAHIHASVGVDSFEVIVVDNGSVDSSVEDVRREFPHVKIIEAGRNLGFAAANNRAIAECRGRYVLLVNTDANVEPDCASRLVALMEADPQVGMVGPQLLNADRSRQTSFETPPTLATETLNRSLLKRILPNRYPSKNRVYTEPTPVEAVIGAVMLLRKSALDEVNNFDEDYFFFLEETDLALRLHRAGYKVIHHPGVFAVHLQGGTAKSYRSDARIEFYRSRYTFFRKHYGNARCEILKAVCTLNLTLSVLGLGIAVPATLGQVDSLRRNFALKKALWKWHLDGTPNGVGLPRT